MKQKVAIGLSGGVDSSLGAALLIEQGFEVTGVYITCWDGPGCRSEEDRKDALDMAMQLDIPFVHLDYQKEYKEKVYEYMIREYEAGRTPNPDAMCNREIKFGLFYEWGMEKGFDYVATGHYAQIKKGEYMDSPLQLHRSVDEHKDQTYFLYQLRQEQLGHILFPIGHLTKSEVREEAARRGLLTAKKPDSVGICFIGEQPMDTFLEERIKPKQGDILLNNDVVGQHKGAWFYTIGQKIGLDQRKIKEYDPQNLPHFYVIDKDIEKNILFVGTDEKLFKNEIQIGEFHSIAKFQLPISNMTVRIRHTGDLVEVEEILRQAQDDNLKIKLTTTIRAVAPGQVAVLYQGERCLGGGIIL